MRMMTKRGAIVFIMKDLNSKICVLCRKKFVKRPQIKFYRRVLWCRKTPSSSPLPATICNFFPFNFLLQAQDGAASLAKREANRGEKIVFWRGRWGILVLQF